MSADYILDQEITNKIFEEIDIKYHCCPIKKKPKSWLL